MPAVETNMTNPGRTAQQIVDQVQRVIVGRPQSVRHAVYALLARGHCLFEDVPGLAKTLLAKTIAASTGLQFARVQFTPDLLPADITGSYVYNQKTQAFALRKGPIFTNLLLADEVNRAPPKTQSALLEGMQEYQVTLEGSSHALPQPFHVFATQNPIESEGVYALPEAELDRFLLRVSMGYPDHGEEVTIMERFESWDGSAPKTTSVVSTETLVRLQQAVRRVFLHPDLKKYIAHLVHFTRRDDRVLVGSSPRGSLALLMVSKASALYHGRDFVTADDVKEMAGPALAHRILLRPEALARGVRADDVMRDALAKTPTPQVPPGLAVKAA